MSAAVLGLLAVAASQAAPAGVDLVKVRLGGDAAETRVVLDLDKSASVRVVSDGAADRRVVILLPGVAAAEGLQGGARGLVRSWAVDQTATGARLQMDLATDAKVRRRFLLPPADGVTHYRYVIDVTAATPPETRLTKAEAAPGPAKVRAQFPAARAPLPLKKVVVIDAGHGGRDAGASGAASVEKDITLAAARTLKSKLEKTGRYKVVMTRDADVFVPLENRVRIAQRANADLFISLHADAGPPDLRGASAYTLSDKASQRGAKFASQDDWFLKAGASGDRRVSDILFDLTQRATRNRSAVFAQTVLAHVEEEAPLLRRSHRDAGFMVLLAPDVPAVLLEMGFISNAQDEALLRDAERRTRMMNAVAKAIDAHFATGTRLAAR